MAQEYPQLLLKNQLCFPLYACSRKIVGSYTPYLKPLGLTYTQYLVLMVLWEHENINVGQLGSILYLDAGTLTPLLKRLEKAGYVTRERSKEDERITVISITDEGSRLKEKCKDIPAKMASCKFPLSEKDAKELYRLLYLFLEEE
ncbi:MAG: MarR family transcriptional regulator [Lachnospiraceae bacterium]|nr:MarR family transcriptional regulator [Lachnospiraceae bacterium]MBQ9605569.1 MarR family transcriptional regulator [Lachnospiraceae bacterium]MBR1523294.1 MarR family transcriptional regulator [Lachnospiraceae bacterium]